MGAKCTEVVCDEHGIGGGDEYCGNSDAQLDRINEFLAPHTSGPRDVPRCGALSLLQKTLHYRGVQQKPLLG
jgi:tubulin beta